MKINNLPKEPCGRYIVARYIDGELWFYGAYSDCAKANQVAANIDGVVI